MSNVKWWNSAYYKMDLFLDLACGAELLPVAPAKIPPDKI
jgi:hypothetical protein